MRQLPKTELSPDNGCVIDMKWQLGPLSYHASAAGKEPVPLATQSTRLPEIVLYDHVGFKGAYARTNLSFHYVGDFWNDRVSCLIVVSGVWRFYRDDYYKGPYWDLGPGYYESFFAEKGFSGVYFGDYPRLLPFRSTWATSAGSSVIGTWPQPGNGSSRAPGTSAIKLSPAL